jgi:hypothetical protein
MRKAISADQYAAIRQVGELREQLKAQIQDAKEALRSLKRTKQLVNETGLPANTVRQILRGRGYAGRPLTLSQRQTNGASHS